jgi:hypothetical protein
MITRQNQTKLQQSQEFISHSFGIKQEGLSHIFNVLRNQLYSDKILAVIREYSTNAIDAHVEVSKGTLPIEVSLPTKLKLEFKVRDYGRGLTDEQISQVYAMYGESTKRGTNEQIGQLGLGCKSAFAYGDNFVINSYVKGIKTSYNAFIDPSQVGRISRLSVEKSKEESGIEIVIPVKMDDVDEFYTKAVNLFKYFQICPTIKGAKGRNLEEDLSEKIVIEADDKSWQLTDGNAVAIMGNIAYEIDNYALNLSWSSDATDRLLYELLNAGIRLHCKIGELDIAASREALQYTDQTKGVLINRLKDCIKELPDLFTERFKVCKTLWEAKLLYKDFFSHGGFGSHVKNIVEKRKGVSWNGIAVTDSHFDFTQFKGDDAKCIRFGKSHGYKTYAKVRGSEAGHLMADSECLVIFDDRSSPNGRLNRIAPLMEEYEGQPKDHKKYDKVYLLTFADDSFHKEWLKDSKFDLVVKNLSDYTPVKLRDIYPSNSTTANSSKVKPAKHQTKEFTFNRDADYGNSHNCRSDYFDSVAVDLQNDSGVYVEIDGFFIHAPMEIHPHRFRKKLSGLESLGLEVPEIFAFKPPKADKVKDNDNWTLFADWAEEKITGSLSKEQLQEMKDREYALKHFENQEKQYDSEPLKIDGCRHGGADDKPELDLKKLIVDEESPYLDYYNKYKLMIKSRSHKRLDKAINATRAFGFGTKLDDIKPTYDLDNIINDVLEKYPMLHYGIQHTDWQWKENIAKEWINYINLIDITWQTATRMKKVKKITNIFDPNIVQKKVAEVAKGVVLFSPAT